MVYPEDRPTFDPRGRERVFMAIADELRARIEDGTYPPDGRLPSIADLIHEYGAARETVRKAVRLLAEQGLVEVVPGKGAFVTRPEERTP
jgi:DNA-binding GntR family transcriptional regulator